MTNQEKIDNLNLAADLLENNWAFLFRHEWSDIWHRGDFDQSPKEKGFRGDLSRIEVNIFRT